MMLGILSDTHDNMTNAKKAVNLLIEEGSQAIVHLGDYVAPFTLKAILETIPPQVPFYGVFGNNDGEKPGLLEAAGRRKAHLTDPPLSLELAGRRLLLLHGFGAPGLTREIAEALASSGKWDAVLYGHTHESDHRRLGETLLLNPGETAGALNEPSVALLDLDSMEARIIRL